MSNFPSTLPERPLSIPSVSHYRYRRSGNIDPMAKVVTSQDCDVYYSYDTVVAIRTMETGLCVCENVWSKITGAHLNAIDRDHSRRLDSCDFDRLLEELTHWKITEPTEPTKRRNLVRD